MNLVRKRVNFLIEALTFLYYHTFINMKLININNGAHRNIIENYFFYLQTIYDKKEDITIKAIIPYLKVSKGTFYRYFDGIDDLNDSSLRFFLYQFISAINSMFISPPNYSIIESVAMKLNFMKVNYKSVLVLYDESDIEEKLFTYVKLNNSNLYPYLYCLLELFSLIKLDEDCSKKEIISILNRTKDVNNEYMEHFKGVL